MILAVTGHRPEKLGNDYSENAQLKLIDFAIRELSKLKLDKVITGMAVGWDQAVAVAALELKIPILAAVPFSGQEKLWPKESRDIYNAILKHELVDSYIVCPGGFASWKMQKRNEWMVDNCNILLALFDEKVKTGGTKNCVEYASKQNKKIINIWKEWVNYL